MRFLFALLFSLLLIQLTGQSQQQDRAKDSIALQKHFRYDDYQSTPVTTILNKDVIRLLGGSATGLLSRISGVTFVKGTLVSFRGLSPRYTNITLDGLPAPITEQNVKAFALGLLPGATLQAMEVYKSGYFYNQGEWGGAFLNIITNAELDENFNQVSFNIGYQHNFTFQDFLQDTDYGTKAGDYFGYGVEPRDFTNDVVSREELQRMNRNQSAKEGKNLRNTWELQTITGIPNIAFAYSFGRILTQKGDRKFSTINSILYSRKMGGANYNRARYTGYVRDEEDNVIDSDLDSYMTDGTYQTKTDIAINSAWDFRFNKDNDINLDFVYSHSGANNTMGRYYIGLNNNKEVYYAQYGILAKGIFLTRLRGQHHVGRKHNFNWALGLNYSTRREPDLRRTAAQRNLDQPDEPFLLVIPESSKADNGARFNSNLTDVGLSGRIDYDLDIKENNRFNLKVGLLGETTTREFAARILTTAKDDFTTPELRFVPMQNLATVFAPENYGPEGYYLVDGTTDFDIYDAQSVLVGGYAGLDNSFGNKWKTSIGLRIENFTQTLESGNIDVDNSQTDYLPYIDINFQANYFTAIKFSYSQSVNRPAFRELAPFIFYDFDYRADIQGNPDLKNAKLHNLDLNILFIFGRNEYLSLGAFYKNIDDPIEMIYIIRSELPLFSFDNADQAQLAGFEIELNKFLSNNTQSFMSRFLLNGNFTYTSSVIELGEETNEVASNRPLQGQIPIVAAVGITYVGPQKAAQVTLGYRYIGQALYSVGDGQETFPWYDKPRNLLNAGLAYEFKNKIKLAFTALNLLNAPLIQIEDTNLNGKINDAVDNEVQYGLVYQTYNLTVSYKF